MAYLSETINIKEELLRVFLHDGDIVALITNEKATALPALNLRYERIFPYEYVPETSTQTNNYITFDIEVIQNASAAVKKIRLYVYAFCHYKTMNVNTAAAKYMGISERGPRKDILSKKIDEALNGKVNNEWFSKLTLVKTTLFQPAKEYAGNCLIYEAETYNRIDEGIHGDD